MSVIHLCVDGPCLGQAMFDISGVTLLHMRHMQHVLHSSMHSPAKLHPGETFAPPLFCFQILAGPILLVLKPWM